MNKADKGKTLVLYDGACALCNRTTRFLLDRDSGDVFRFAALQSQLGRELVERDGGDSSDIGTVVVLTDYGTDDERVLKRSRAILRAVTQLGGAWSLLHVFRAVPAFILDLGYRLVARLRYRAFGKHESCPLPEPQHRHKFLAGSSGD